MNCIQERAISPLLAARDFRVLLWECSLEQNWAKELQELVAPAGVAHFDLMRVEGTVEATLAHCRSWKPHLLLIGAKPSDPASGAGAVREIRAAHVLCPILVIAEAHTTRRLNDLFEAGASDFLPSPLRKGEVLARLARWLRHPGKVEPRNAEANPETGLTQVKGASPALQLQLHLARRFACSDSSVLICGETGTGKEIFARGIHEASSRALNPFVAVNCGALPVDLVENELFGHEEGAFTGARRTHTGLIQQAEGGTLFLDEIDSLPMSAQSKLLRFLQQREYRPLGASRSRIADVRVISASNRNLNDAIRAGHFRQDLYFRLSVLLLRLPPLREHPEDIPLLARHILAAGRQGFTAARVEVPQDGAPGQFEDLSFGQPSNPLTPAALKKLSEYDWPGNVRELENVLERALLLARSPVVDAADLDIPVRRPGPSHECFRDWKARTVYEMEDAYIRDLLAKHGGHITRAARGAGIERRTFFGLLQKHGLTRPARKQAP